MIDERELDAAVGAGIVDAATRDRLVAFARDYRRGTAGPDEEQFRFLTGFNDIFVTIAIGLVIVAVTTLAGRVAPWVAALAVAATAWGLAEYFTRRRRMALPSIVLLGVFVAAAYFGAGHPVEVMRHIYAGGYQLPDGQYVPKSQFSVPDQWINIHYFWAAALAGLAAAMLHWWRFRVPITVAAGALVVSLTLILVTGGTAAKLVALACGVGVFALAMQFDSRDPARVTRNTDIAFWLHLLAAPLIVHPLFMGLADARPGHAGAALAVIGIYLLLGLVALAIDRRALLVSGLAYVVAAIGTLIERDGGLGQGFAVTALIVGVTLVLLAAGWRPARARVLALLPGNVSRRLPPAAYAN